jgi:hypothetical protein
MHNFVSIHLPLGYLSHHFWAPGAAHAAAQSSEGSVHAGIALCPAVQFPTNTPCPKQQPRLRRSVQVCVGLCMCVRACVHVCV